MSKPLSLSFFPTSTPAGMALREGVEELARQWPVRLNIPSQPTPFHVAKACWNADIVIFDATIEAEGHNYTIAYEPLKRVRHALLVSRTPLPLNFRGLRAGGAPEYPHTLSNEAILAWLAEQVPTMQPRRWSEKGLIFQLIDQGRSLDWEIAQRKQQGQIFVSYRSRYSADVQHLQTRLQQGEFHQGQPRSMFFFSPGSLAFEDEIMSAMRRWMIVSMIREYITDCEEFWLYQTDDYLDSWWTRAELATFLYRKKTNLRIYDANAGTARIGSLAELPALTDEDRKRLARWYANTDPSIMGAESAMLLGRMAQTPLGTLPFFKDTVWKDEFQHYPVMQCSSEQCRRAAEGKTAAGFHFDLSGLLWLRDENLFPIESQRLQDAAEGQASVACPRCGAVYRIKREPLDRYLYLALPVGKGPEGKSSQALPVYRAEPLA